MRRNVEARNDVTIRRALHLAARQGRTQTLSRLLSRGSDSVDAADEQGNTPLHVAVVASRTDAVRLLVLSRADISRRNLADQTPLDLCLRENLAVHRDKYKIISILVSAAAEKPRGLGVSDVIGSGNSTCNIMAGERGFANANVTKRSSEVHPIRNDFVPRIRQKPSRSKPVYTMDDYWKTTVSAPRRLTRNVGNYSASSDTDESLPVNRRPSIASGMSAESLDEFSGSLLLLAVIGGTVPVIKSLLVLPVDVNMRDVDGQSPLHLAVVSGRKRITRMLLRHGACANAADRRHRRPLHLAAVLPSGGGICKMLLRHDAEVNAADETGVTSLHCAAKIGQRPTVKLLLDGGAAVNMADVHSQLAIHIATGRGSLDTVELLLWRGSQVNAADDKGRTPLHLAAVTPGGVDIVRVLILHDACVNVPDADGRTSLHLACAAGRADVVRALLNRGADVNARDRNGACAYQLALRHAHVTSVIRCHVTNATLYAPRLHATREEKWRNARREKQDGGMMVMSSTMVGERLAKHNRAPRRGNMAGATGPLAKHSKRSRTAAKGRPSGAGNVEDDNFPATPAKPCCVTM